MVKITMEIPTEECLQRCLRAAKKYIAAYDDMEKHNVGINDVIQAVRSDDIISLSKQHGLKAKTAATLLDMYLTDLLEDRREYYKKVVENLIPLVGKQDEQEYRR